MYEYTIVIPYYDNSNVLDLCLQHLTMSIPENIAEIIVVNDNPVRPLARTTIRDDITIVDNASNLGYSASCNRGANCAAGRFLIFLDADIVPTEGWLQSLRATYELNQKIGAVSSKILDLSTGDLAYFGFAFHEIDILKPFQGSSSRNSLALASRQFQAVPSGSMMIEKHMFQEAGCFDEGLLNCFGDLDLSLKLKSKGREMWVSGQSIVYHRGTVSGLARYAYYSDVRSLFFRKWGTKIENDGLSFLELAANEFASSGVTKNKNYIVVNFSTSLFSDNYVDVYQRVLGIAFCQHYRFRLFTRPASGGEFSRIRLEDFLPWDVCLQPLPIFFFCDNVNQLASNFYWFSKRRAKYDILADRHANIVFAGSNY